MRLVAIGGCIPVVTRLIGLLPTSTGHAFAVVPDGGGDGVELAARLRAHTTMPVVTTMGPVVPRPDHVYIAPHGSELTVAENRIASTAPLATNDARCAIDRLFRSIASEYGAAAIAVLVAGEGTDGSIGLKLLKERGGVTIAQAPGEATPDEMTRIAVATGFVDFVLPLSGIAAQLAQLESPAIELPPDERAEEAMRELLVLVKVRTGHDFAQYKRSTLQRRVARRVQVTSCRTLGEYLVLVRRHTSELTALLRDFMISVTNFFRDPEFFGALEVAVLPKLFALSPDPIRVWVPGCATGEEVYSLAMLLLEQRARHDPGRALQIFATDIDHDALADARAGRYPKTIAADVSADRLERFFTRDGEHVVVTKEVRAHVLFAAHNILHDAPFSRLDLFSCRNLLIYLERPMQDHVLRTAHFALKPDRFLFLGSSENADTADHLFEPLDPTHRIYARQSSVPAVFPSTSALPRWSPPPLPRPEAPPANAPGELHYRLVEQLAPPSVLVSPRLEISHFSERAGRYFVPSPGEPTRDLFLLALPELRLDLRAAVYAARRAPGLVAAGTSRCRLDGELRQVRTCVRVEAAPDPTDANLLVWFEESALPPDAVVEPAAPDQPHIEPVVRQLEEELRHARDQLRTTIEQYEALVEELHASNEELQAINEELRSASEEIEASREEADSVNQELMTVNQELKLRVAETITARSDMANLMEASDIGVIFMDRELRIFRFTQPVREIFNIIDSDIGRPLTDLNSKIHYPELIDDARHVLETLVPIDREVGHHDHGSFLARLRPYRSLDDRIAGVVMTFVDVTAMRRIEDALRNKEAMLALAERAANAGTWELDATAHARMSAQCHRLYGTPASDDPVPLETWTQTVVEADRARLAEAIEGAVRGDAGASLDIDFQIALPELGERWLWMLGRKTAAGAEIAGITLDVTSARAARRVLEDADRRKNEFIATLAHELRNPLTPLAMALDIQEAAAGNAEQIEAARAMMVRQVTQLRRLVDDLLDMSRIQSGRLQLQIDTQIDLTDVVALACADVRPIVAERRHRLIIDLAPELRIDGDRARLAQLFDNLLANAAKYTDPGGTITVTAAPGPDAVTVTVADTGIGIAPAVLPRIFDVFVQAESLITRTRGGLGLGLSVARQIVELHGGTLTAHSAGLGKGSRFTVALPVHHGKGTP